MENEMGTKHIGDLIIATAEQAKSYAHIEEVTGYLYIRADAQLPVLTSVGGSLDIRADAQLPVLTSVGGYLDIRADAQLPVLTSVGDYLYIGADAQLPVLTSVGGSLYIRADAQLPVLTSVGGYLYIGADAQLPVLTSVGGYLYICADAQLPVLTSVGGSEITMRPIWVLGLHYSVTILDQTMRIGCQEHALSDWASFDNAQIAEMDGKQALTFWAEQKTKLLDFAAEHGRVISKEVA